MSECRKNLVKLLLDQVHARASLFADPNGEPYADLTDGDVLRLRARGFRAPNRLAGHLRNLAPILRAHGIDVAPLRTRSSRLLVVTRRTISAPRMPEIRDGAGSDASGEWSTITNERVSA
jgi:hypothetical protein